MQEAPGMQTVESRGQLDANVHHLLIAESSVLLPFPANMT